ncbi:MAG: glutathione peroxidase [Gammaproteobacteria bacterium]|nr:glutathione peroxidase [Gammaproteobacteria bacterium]
MLANFSVQANCSQLLNIEVRALAGQEKINLCETYADKVVLIVNTASKCGFTPQYDGLEALYEKYKHRGLVILGFPSNDFGQQEPGSEKQIADFCRLTYGVKFPMFEKTQVRKHHADELYQRLGKAAGEFPLWNFHKYLLNRRGELVKSFNSKITPQDVKLIEEIETLL